MQKRPLKNSPFLFSSSFAYFPFHANETKAIDMEWVGLSLTTLSQQGSKGSQDLNGLDGRAALCARHPRFRSSGKDLTAGGDGMTGMTWDRIFSQTSPIRRHHAAPWQLRLDDKVSNFISLDGTWCTCDGHWVKWTICGVRWFYSAAVRTLCMPKASHCLAWIALKQFQTCCVGWTLFNVILHVSSRLSRSRRQNKH